MSLLSTPNTVLVGTQSNDLGGNTAKYESNQMSLKTGGTRKTGGKSNKRPGSKKRLNKKSKTNKRKSATRSKTSKRRGTRKSGIRGFFGL